MEVESVFVWVESVFVWVRVNVCECVGALRRGVCVRVCGWDYYN